MADFGVTEYLAIAGLAGSAIGTYAQIEGAGQQAEATSRAANYQAQVARNNQQIAEQLAQSARDSGESRVEQKRQQIAATLGEQEAAQGARGLDINSGSNLDVRSSAASLGELDALTIRDAAERQAYGYEVQGAGFGAQADLDVATGENALRAGALNQFTSLAGGASSVADKWMMYKYYKPGAKV